MAALFAQVRVAPNSDAHNLPVFLPVFEEVACFAERALCCHCC